MKEQIVSFEIAKLAKEKGFNEKCIFFYGRTFPDLHFNNIFKTDSFSGADFFCYAPTEKQLKNWLIEKHNISEEELKEGLNLIKNK